MPQEQAFEDRISKILKANGFLVENVKMPFKGGQSYDLIAVKSGKAYPIEIKGRDTSYPDEQRDKQIGIAHNCRTNFFLIQQSTTRTKRGFLINIAKYSIYSRRFTSHICPFDRVFDGLIEEE